MYRFTGFLSALALLGLLAGCASHLSKTSPDESDIKDAESDMHESKLDYESCLRDQEEEVEIDCEIFKEIYEEDRETYEYLIKLKKAKAGR